MTLFIGDSYRVPGKVHVTYVLIGLNILSFFVVFYRMNPFEMIHDGQLLILRASDVFVAGGIIPSEWFGPGLLSSAQRPPEIISLIWSFFLHGSWHHLLLNMAFLFLFGPNLEAKMGRFYFTLFYFSCAGAGAVLQVFFDTSSLVPIIGASGAIAGLLGAYFVLFKDHFFQIDFGRLSRRSLIFPIYTLILFWLISQILNGIAPLLFRNGGFEPVAYFAHIGGFICGFFLAYHQKSAGQKPQKSRFRVFNGGRK